MTGAMRRLWPKDAPSRVAVLSIAMNATLMVIGVTIGLIADSVAVLSDGIDNGQDTIAAAIALASVRIGRRPPDAEHPYGHGRAETLAASLRGLLIAGGGIFIVVRSVQRMLEAPDEIGADLGIAAMVLAAAANLALVQYASRVAKESGSPAITAEAQHLRTNVVQAGAVLLSLVAVSVSGEVIFDPLIALALGAYLVWTAGVILLSAAGDVLDARLSDEEIAMVSSAILDEGIDDLHELRTRRSGQTRHIDFHLVLPGTMTVEESHAVSNRIEARIESMWPGSVVTVHVEPSSQSHPDDPGL